MRIRKRSIAALSSTSPWEKPAASVCAGEEAEAEAEAKAEVEAAAAAAAAAKGKEFLLPLVAAVMDVQAKADFTGGDATIIPTAGHEIPEIHTRPVPKWRNALLRGNAESEAVKVSGEADKSICKWNGIIRKNREDKSGLLTSEAGVKEGKTSSLEKDMPDLDRHQELPESDRSLDLDAATDKKQRSKLHFSHINGERDDSTKMRRKDPMTIQRNSPKKKDKIHENDNNLHAGSQCRRRNGRGWRCSERTLVGYFLCEHHLGKGRLKSINTSKGAASPVVVNVKGTKFKELHLIHAAAPSL